MSGPSPRGLARGLALEGSLNLPQVCYRLGSAKSKGNETRAATAATAAAGGGSARIGGQAVCMLEDIVSLLTAYLVRLQVVYSSSSSIQVHADGLYAGYGALI